MAEVKIDPEIFPKRLSTYLFGVCFLLVICDVVFTYLDVTGYYLFRRTFDMTREESIPNWYASILLFAIALTNAWIFFVSRATRGRRVDYFPWAFFSSFFLFLSMDDGARIHERTGDFFRGLTEDGVGLFISFQGVLETASTWAWQIFVLPVFLFVGFFMLFWGGQRVVNPIARRAVLLGAGAITIAIGLDYVEGLIEFNVIDINNLAISAKSFMHFQRVTEELLEMVGFVFVLRGLLVHLLGLTTAVVISAEREEGSG